MVILGGIFVFNGGAIPHLIVGIIRRGVAGHGGSGSGAARRGSVRHGKAWSGGVHEFTAAVRGVGLHSIARHSGARLGVVQGTLLQGLASGGKLRLGALRPTGAVAGFGAVVRGVSWFGRASFGRACSGVARHCGRGSGKERNGVAVRGQEWSGFEFLQGVPLVQVGRAWRAKAGSGWVERGVAWSGFDFEAGIAGVLRGPVRFGPARRGKLLIN